jgi:hypothetical protein
LFSFLFLQLANPTIGKCHAAVLHATRGDKHAKTRDTPSITNVSLCISGPESYLDFRWTGLCSFMWRKSRKHDLSRCLSCTTGMAQTKIGRTALQKDGTCGGSVCVEGEHCHSDEATLVAWARSLTIRKLYFQPHRVLPTESTEESLMVLTAVRGHRSCKERPRKPARL